jgi:hypothetical protein
MRASLLIGAAVAATMIFGTTGIASADDQYVGQTYAEAKEALSKAGKTSQIGSVVGGTLPTAQCTVTGSRTEPVLGDSGATGGTQVVLDLDCDTPAATQGQQEQPAAAGDNTDADADLQSTMDQQIPGENG